METALGTLSVNGTSEQLYETNETIHLAFPAEKLVILENKTILEEDLKMKNA